LEIALKNLKLQQGTFTLTANLRISPNQTTAVLGPSGGGKSTLLMLMAGFLQPSSGSILLAGKNITNTPPAKRPLTMLFQGNNLFPHLTVFQNTALGISPNLKLTPFETERVHQALHQVGLVGRDNDLPANLSGGQRQRVALARALLRQQPVLLLDEPFAALGPGLRHEMLELVESIRAAQNATLLLVTHNPQDAQHIAPETIVVIDGHVSSPQPTTASLKNPPKSLAAYLGNPPLQPTP